MEFEREPNKASANLKKHGVSFKEAGTVFSDGLSVTIPDPDHSLAEERFIIIGLSDQSRLLIVSYTERSALIRIIRARELTRAEREDYERGDF